MNSRKTVGTLLRLKYLWLNSTRKEEYIIYGLVFCQKSKWQIAIFFIVSDIILQNYCGDLACDFICIKSVIWINSGTWVFNATIVTNWYNKNDKTIKKYLKKGHQRKYSKLSFILRYKKYYNSSYYFIILECKRALVQKIVF